MRTDVLWRVFNAERSLVKKVLKKLKDKDELDSVQIWDSKTFGNLRKLDKLLVALLTILNREGIQIDNLHKGDLLKHLKNLVGNKTGLLQMSRKNQIKEVKKLGEEEWFNRFRSEIIHIDSALEKILSEEEKNRRVLEFQKLENRNKSANLDPLSLSKVELDLRSFLGKKDNSYFETKYIPLLSVLFKIFGDNLSHRVLVEIGPNLNGLPILAYLASKGASATGLDPENLKKSAEKYPHIDFKQGRWEEIGEFFKPETVDVFYTEGMVPNPNKGGIYEHDLKKFESFVSLEMDKTLKPGGFYLGHEMGNDYSLPEETFEKLKYSTSEFTALRLKSLSDIPRTKFEIEKWNLYMNSPEFGKRLVVYQKPR